MTAPTPKQIELFSRRSAKRQSPLITALVPIARELALAAGRRGIIMSDVRIEAQKRGIEIKHGDFLGALGRAAGLIALAEWRRSELDQAHGNLNRVWIHPDYAPTATAATA